ncbi:MAG: Gfo/Idh/MocA family oxidoreductase [Candidatus Thiodiazotropha lotti]|uniref:Oxidoreductase n=1 Tax=Candidatus Thiodiazotropha endoloripes TaxID=1818881 RepID=A0A1E2UQQ3_9GAMM|nr:Gfo/Idh/MocA family oxidoreductase [Candidatus Thiodiazotropha endoloripes]MCG7899044.1 Gfo/Idh/MocA family oxidoreductase [Candidatus Thiodiazotropha weberae]MCG7992450.1 Gfo/Idh/MocA family oxidoreductase [Candidatus Thiodiazotropha lotti]MCG7900799.1 Gfo/Idh/MocA family oxidoreductase [Candidatus Thiodiazotropha weberae]MCG7914857.1 Gfo/Idh/MocA family oxidoreductase [Candidatus Thiodiazotropha weberae]MCG8001495.1 Gfo/Idh/MocA family oxidoreductase [Candidatus Thiodiazotropha lotti]
MTASPLALAFIGGALDSAVGYTHYAACRMDGRWQLVAGAFSTDDTINRETAKAYGVTPERTYSHWSEMISKEKGQLDAVVILTPTPSHQPIVTECLAQGVAVICEKALATSSAEIEEILTTRNQHNGFLAITYNYSGYPMLRELRSLIRSGELGRILHFQAEMPQEGFRRVDSQGEKPVPQDWRLHDGEIPTIYLDLAVHLHQLIHYLTGQHPLQVVADQAKCGWFDVIDNVSCLCRYSAQIMGQLWFSKSALGHRNGLKIRIYGSDASAEWLQANPEELHISHADGRRQILDRGETTEIAGASRYTRFKAGHPAGFVEAFANLYQDIAAGLIAYQASSQWHSDEVYSGELALEGTNMFAAMIRSFKQRKWVNVQATTNTDSSQD